MYFNHILRVFAFKGKIWLWNINIFTIRNILFGKALVFVISYMFLFIKDLHNTSIIQSKKYMSNLSKFTEFSVCRFCLQQSELNRHLKSGDIFSLHFPYSQLQPYVHIFKIYSDTKSKKLIVIDYGWCIYKLMWKSDENIFISKLLKHHAVSTCYIYHIPCVYLSMFVQ